MNKEKEQILKSELLNNVEINHISQFLGWLKIFHPKREKVQLSAEINKDFIKLKVRNDGNTDFLLEIANNPILRRIFDMTLDRIFKNQKITDINISPNQQENTITLERVQIN